MCPTLDGIRRLLRPDIDNDGDDDMFVGEGGGAMLFYRNKEDPPSPELSVTLTPQNPSIQIPAGGGSFKFDVEILTDDPVNYVIDVSTNATLPNGSPYPLLLRENITLPASGSLSREGLTQYVPANAPSGEYSYNALVAEGMSSGVYFAKLETGNITKSMKILLLK